MYPAASELWVPLGDRRVLFNPYWQEETGECVSSVIDVRTMLTLSIIHT